MLACDMMNNVTCQHNYVVCWQKKVDHMLTKNEIKWDSVTG